MNTKIKVRMDIKISVYLNIKNLKKFIMKKILTILLICITINSCNTREKVPTNINDAINEVNITKVEFIKFEKMVDKISDDSIKNLSEIDAYKWISEETFIWEKYSNAESKLDDILKC